MPVNSLCANPQTPQLLTSVNSSSVDRVEIALRIKIETLTNYAEDPARAVAQVFKKFDKNGSGKLNLEEFLAGMKALNFEGFEKDCTALFYRYDLDHSGTLDFKEFGCALFSTGDKKLRATSTIGRIREALTIRAGGFLELRDLARQFKIMDSDGNGHLTKEELKGGLAKFLRVFNFELKRTEFEKLFNAFDIDGDGTLSYSEFIRGIRGEMNERRKEIVKLAFDMLDEDKSGHVTFEEVRAKYDVTRHPKVLGGQWTAEQAIKDFMAPWNKNGDDVIDWAEFLEYYEWVSPNIDNDDYFELMIRNAFHLSGGEGWAANTTCRRVLVTHQDGKQTVEEVKNDFGIGLFDYDKIMANLRAQGLNPAEIKLVN